METLRACYLPLLVWLSVIGLVIFFIKMVGWAKKGKGAAMAFGIFFQMFLPDPKAQITIEFIAESKQEKADKSGQADKKDKGDKGE